MHCTKNKSLATLIAIVTTAVQVKFDGVFPRADWAMTEWGSALGSASNIVFANGDLDPWSGGGVLTSPTETAVALIIRGRPFP